jgi:hypothetical protein
MIMKIPSTAMLRLLRIGWPLGMLLMAGCANHPEPDNIRFGESVRHTIALQTTDPSAGATGLDGEKAEKALREYRGFAGSPTEVPSGNVIFDLGN